MKNSYIIITCKNDTHDFLALCRQIWRVDMIYLSWSHIYGIMVAVSTRLMESRDSAAAYQSLTIHSNTLIPGAGSYRSLLLGGVIISKFATRSRGNIEVCYSEPWSYRSLLLGAVIISKFVTRSRDNIKVWYSEPWSYRSLLLGAVVMSKFDTRSRDHIDVCTSHQIRMLVRNNVTPDSSTYIWCWFPWCRFASFQFSSRLWRDFIMFSVLVKQIGLLHTE